MFAQTELCSVLGVAPCDVPAKSDSYLTIAMQYFRLRAWTPKKPARTLRRTQGDFVLVLGIAAFESCQNLITLLPEMTEMDNRTVWNFQFW
jgi:hypothetical protein